MIQQGEIWLAEQPHEKARPYLVLTRQRGIESLNAVSVAPLTTRVRGLVSEVPLGAHDGLQRHCVANFDNVRSMPKSAFTRRVGVLAAGRWHEVCQAMRAAINC